jgi:hypothetical protein
MGAGQRFIQVKQFMPENKGVLKVWRIRPMSREEWKKRKAEEDPDIQYQRLNKLQFTDEGVEQRVAALLVELDEAWPTNGYRLVHVGGLNFNLVWDAERAKENTERFELEQAAKKLEEMENGKTDIQGNTTSESRVEGDTGIVGSETEDAGDVIARGLAGSGSGTEAGDPQDRQGSPADRDFGDQTAVVGADAGGSDGSVEDTNQLCAERTEPIESGVSDVGVDA